MSRFLVTTTYTGIQAPLASWQLKNIFREKVKIYGGAILQTTVNAQQPTVESLQIENSDQGSPLTIFLTHGHQGDAQSDGNWFSKFFVAYIWAPLQSLLKINPNTPAYNSEKKTLHNTIMYDWSATQENMLLVTGHTHQPVFASLTLLERLYKELQLAERDNDEIKVKEVKNEILKRESDFTAVAIDYMTMKPSYFNTGCCCFSDGDITGIEISDGYIRLIKWSEAKGREVLEERALGKLV